MKKLLSLFAIILILATLASCSVNYYVPSDNVEDDSQDSADDAVVNLSMTEKEKRSIYDSAMTSLRAKDWAAAYNYFTQIPDYEDVADYLVRFSFKAETTMILDITEDSEGTKIFQYDTSMTDYGYLTGEILYDYRLGSPKDYKTNINDKTDTSSNRIKRMTVAKQPSIFGDVAGYSLDYTYVNDASSIVASEVKNLSGTAFTKNYTYNADMSIQKINITWTRNTIPYNYEFRYVYSAGKLTSIKFVDLTPNADATVRDYAVYSYNAAGQLTSVSYPGGSIDPAYHYSVFTGTPNAWVAPNWDEANAYTVTYEYNALGQLAKEVLNYANSDDKDQTITYDLYNEDGVVVEKTLSYGGKLYRYSYEKIKLYYDPYR